MVEFDAHKPAVGVKVYVVVPIVAVLIGPDHVPVMPLFEVVGKVGAALFSHKGVTWVNTGEAAAFTTISNVVFAAHKPVVGVKVYVVVPGVDVVIGADQVPVIPFVDVVERTGAVLF